MKVIIGGVYQPTLEGDSIRIQRSMSDPVPTCTLNLKDNNSSIFVQAMQEILVLDDQIIPNPTMNLLLNPTMNPYNTNGWNATSSPDMTTAQNTGGGVIITANNTITGFYVARYTQSIQQVVLPGQQYVLSVTAQMTSPVNIAIAVGTNWTDAAGGTVTNNNYNLGNATISTRYSVTVTVPSNVSFVTIDLGMFISNATNSGSVTFTNVQFEPLWFPTIAYPTPFCGPSQPNCRQLPLGNWIRQYRKFAGFVNHASYGDYRGNVRTVTVDSVGYAWLLSTIYCNNSYTSKTDAFIFSDLLNAYVTSNGTAMVTTTNVITGVTLSSLQSNWDDLRTIFNNLAAQSGFYWTVDFYWNSIYAPPGYYSMMISLICDNSIQPDFVTTFPTFNFSAEMDYTQPSSTVLVLGNGANTAKVVDGSTVMQNGLISGYFLPNGSSYMRKINESALNNVSDCTQRGIAEMLQYDYPRSIYHLTTDVELIPGYSIPITSATENLNQSNQLIQSVSAQWTGTKETLTDYWEYQADLGATNRTATHIMSRLFRLANGNSSAPSIATTTLALIERIGILDAPSAGIFSKTYQATILGDSPIAYYRLGELLGTIADDYSGSGYAGTLNGGVTLNQAGAIIKDSDGAMKFDGTTGYIACASGLSTSGWTAFTFECWINLTATPTTGNPRIAANSKTDVDFHGFQVSINRTSGMTIAFILGTGTVANTTNTVSAVPVGSYVHFVGVFDGSHTFVYYNGVLQTTASWSAFSINAASNPVSFAHNPATSSDFLGATLDEIALYHARLTRAQIQQHYAVATSPYAVAVKADSPDAYYRLDELTGTTVYDWSNANDGSITGTVTLNQGGALTGSNDNDPSMLFNGTTGYIALTGITLNGSSAFTVEVWIRIPTTYSTFPRIIASDDAQGNLKGFDFGVNPPGTGGAFFNVALNGVWKQVSCSTMFSMSTWYHLAVTYDGTTLTMYVNGASVGTTAATGAITNTTNSIHIGNLNTTFWPGNLDEVALYTSRALTATQISNHYTKGTTH